MLRAWVVVLACKAELLLDGQGVCTSMVVVLVFFLWVLMR